MSHSDQEQQNPTIDAQGNPVTAPIQEAQNLDKYIIFNLGKELYGCPLTSVREILKIPPIKAIPFADPSLSGVINLRGAVLSVVNLGARFGVKKNETQGIILVTETDKGQIGVIVDEVEAVVPVGSTKLDRNPTVSSRIPRQFYIGVGILNERLVNLIDLSGYLQAQKFAA